MPVRLYQLELPQPRELHISWQPGWRNIEIRLAEVHIATITSRQDIAPGKTFSLTDDATLSIKIDRPYRERDLVVSLNGQRIYGNDPALPDIIRVTCQTVFVIGGLLVFFGGIAQLTSSNLLLSIGVGQHSLIIGILFLLLGVFVQRTSTLSLIIAMVLLGTHWLIGISFASAFGDTPHIAGTILHVLLGIPLIRGLPAFDAWGRQFPPTPNQKRRFWRNAAIFAGILLLPLIFLVVSLFWFYP
jgi:hypothetical protein